nr:hypothetical protein [Tanacetum cinerariifolium]
MLGIMDFNILLLLFILSVAAWNYCWLRKIHSKGLTSDTNGIIKVLPPKIAKEVVARERERKVRATLLMALPEDQLGKFHKMADAKEMWEAIKSRFEIHGTGVSHEDTNQKFLRFLPSSWSQVALIMRTKPGLDTLSFDDLYNNVRVFERDVKGTTASSSNTKNVAFVSAKNTSSTNDDILQETAKLKGTKTAKEEMLGTMETKLKTMVEDMHIRMTKKLWLPLMERILTGLDMLRKMLRTMLTWPTLPAI